MSCFVSTARRFILVFVLGSLVMLSGHTAGALAQTPGTASAESEPNDRLSRATLVALPAAVEGRIDPRGDVDWYAFDVPQEGEVHLSVAGARAAGTTAYAVTLRVLNPDGADMSGWVGPTKDSSETLLALDLPEAGRYYVQVADDYSDAVSPQPYALAIAFTPAVDAGEPNKRLTRATSLEIGTPRQGLIFPVGDVDWYAVDVPRDGELQVKVAGAPDAGVTSFTLVFQVFNPNMSAISGWVGPAEKGAATVATLDLPEGGRYYIQVSDDYGDTRSLQPYTIAATFTPAEDAGEPNAKPTQATPLQVGTPRTALIFPAGDVDWYSFDVPQDGQVRLSVEGAPDEGTTNFVLVLQVFNPDGSSMTGWIGPAEPGVATVATVDLPEGGRYFVQVADDYGDARSLQPYTIAATFTPALDAGEPNNRLSQATPMELDVSGTATIFPTGDSDFYWLEAPAPGKLQIALTGIPAKVDITVQVFNADMTVISGWLGGTTPGADASTTVDLPEAGRYYLQVADSYSDVSSVQPYTLKVTFTPAP